MLPRLTKILILENNASVNFITQDFFLIFFFLEKKKFSWKPC